MIEDFLFLADNQHVGLVHNNEFYPVAYLNGEAQLVFTDSHFTPSEYDGTFMAHPNPDKNNRALAFAVFHLGKYHLTFTFEDGILVNFTVHYYDVYSVIRFIVKYNMLYKRSLITDKFIDHRVEFATNDLDPDQTLMVFKILNQLARLR